MKAHHDLLSERLSIRMIVGSDVGYPSPGGGRVTCANVNQSAQHLPSFLQRCVQIFHIVSAMIRRRELRSHRPEKGAQEMPMSRKSTAYVGWILFCLMAGALGLVAFSFLLFDLI